MTLIGRAAAWRHDRALGAEAITARGAKSSTCPYSPDINPIEMAFTKLKALLRQSPRALSTASSSTSATCSTSSCPPMRQLPSRRWISTLNVKTP